MGQSATGADLRLVTMAGRTNFQCHMFARLWSHDDGKGVRKL